MTVLKGSRYADEETSYLILKEDEDTGVQRTEMSRVRPFNIETDPEDVVYVTKQGDTWWSVAGKREIYNDPKMYDVLMSANPTPALFEGMFESIPVNTRLRVPPLEKVNERRGGRSSPNSVRASSSTRG